MYSQVLNNVNNGLFVELEEILNINNVEFKGTKIVGFYVETKNGNKIFIENDEDCCDVRCELIAELFETTYNEEKYGNAKKISYDFARNLFENGGFQFNDLDDLEDDYVELLKWGKYIFHLEGKKVILDFILD